MQHWLGPLGLYLPFRLGAKCLDIPPFDLPSRITPKISGGNGAN